MAKKPESDGAPPVGGEQSQEEGAAPASFILIGFAGPGSSQIVTFQTNKVSLNQLIVASSELQTIANNERWWAFYVQRMKEMEALQEEARQTEAVGRMLAGQGPLGPLVKAG